MSHLIQYLWCLSPRCLRPFQGNLFSQHCVDFQSEDRLTPRWHVGQPCGKASWESLEGKPQIPWSTRMEARQCCYNSRGKRTCMPLLETRTDSPGETSDFLPLSFTEGSPAFSKAKSALFLSQTCIEPELLPGPRTQGNMRAGVRIWPSYLLQMGLHWAKGHGQR